MSRLKPGDLVKLNENSPYGAVYLFNLLDVATSINRVRITKADLCIIVAIVNDELFMMCRDVIGWTSISTYFDVV